jgi:hypothetical protein
LPDNKTNLLLQLTCNIRRVARKAGSGSGIKKKYCQNNILGEIRAPGRPMALLRGNLPGDFSGFRRGARSGLAMSAVPVAVGRGGESSLRRSVEF